MISVILHILIMYLMTLFFSPADQGNSFPSLSVFMIPEADVSGILEQQSKAEPEEVTVSNKTQRSENPVAPADEKIILDEEAVSNLRKEPVIEITQPSAPDGTTGSDTESATGDSPGISSVRTGDDAVQPPPEISGTGTESALDVVWSGASARLRSVTEPAFSLPYGAVLPEEVKVSFEVLSDGTSVSVRIIPPGSGYLNLDQQIRTYVASLIFDPFSDDGQRRGGLLTLNLRHQEPAGR